MPARWIFPVLLALFLLSVPGSGRALPGDRIRSAKDFDSHGVDLVGRWAAGGCRDVVVDGSRAYILDGGRLETVSVLYPGSPVVVGSMDFPSLPLGLTESGVYLYVADGLDGLRIVNKGSGNPIEVSHVDMPEEALGVAADGDYIYVADGDGGLRIITFNYDDPRDPVEVGCYNPSGWNCVHDVEVVGDYAFVAAGYGDLWVIDVGDPHDPFQVGGYDLGLYSASSIAIRGDYAYVVYGNPALVIYDISSPDFPEYVATWDRSGSAEDVAVDDHYAYVADEYDGLRIISVADPSDPHEVGFYDPGSIGYDLAIDGSYAFVALNDDGLAVLDVSDPAHPGEVGFFDPPGPGDARDVAVAGGYAYVGFSPGGLSVLDMSDPTIPTEVGAFETDNSVYEVAVAGHHAYLAEMGAGLRVIDVSDPAHPAEAGWLPVAGAPWGLAVSGDFAYLAGGDAGLRVIDVRDPTNPLEAGFFETAGEADGIAVVGCQAFVMDRYAGLYILDCTEATPAMLQALSVARTQGSVHIAWEVAEETGVQEFRLYRTEPGDAVGPAAFTVPSSGRGRYEVEDPEALLGRAYRYTLAFVGRDGVESVLGSSDLEAAPPAALLLEPNFPNPFNPRTTIAFTVPAPGPVRVEVFDGRGRLVKVLLDEPLNAGPHVTEWDGTTARGRPAPSGVYLCRLQAGLRTASRRMLLVR